MGNTGASMRCTHDLGLKKTFWSSKNALYDRMATWQIPFDRQRWQKVQFDGHLSVLGKKITSLLGIEEKSHEKAHINSCYRESQRIASNGVVAKLIFALRNTCISKHRYYLGKNLAAFYHPVILLYSPFHIQETMVCKIRPCNADIVLASVSILR